MRIRGLDKAIPPVPGAGQQQMGPTPMGGASGLGPTPMGGTGGATGDRSPTASQQSFAKRIMTMAPDKFAKLMQKLGAGPIV